MKAENLGVRVRYVRLDYVCSITHASDSWAIDEWDGKKWRERQQLLYRDMAYACAVRVLERAEMKGAL